MTDPIPSHLIASPHPHLPFFASTTMIFHLPALAPSSIGLFHHFKSADSPFNSGHQEGSLCLWIGRRGVGG